MRPLFASKRLFRNIKFAIFDIKDVKKLTQNQRHQTEHIHESYTFAEMSATASAQRVQPQAPTRPMRLPQQQRQQRRKHRHDPPNDGGATSPALFAVCEGRLRRTLATPSSLPTWRWRRSAVRRSTPSTSPCCSRWTFPCDAETVVERWRLCPSRRRAVIHSASDVRLAPRNVAARGSAISTAMLSNFTLRACL
jgi:hypothetical protein